MFYIEIIVAILLILAFMKYLWTKKENEYQTALLANHIESSDELKKTLAMGLYLRFCKEEEDKDYSSIYLKQDPLQFERFAAEIMEKTRGGSTWVTPPTGDFGVDFEHETEKGLFLGQVKCYQGDLPFDSIALIHSNIIKRGAQGGYVITTGSFTPAAYEYAKGLNVELIDGVKFVESWLSSLSKAEKEMKELLLV
ncbi:restriction endonuclease [Niallia circulans]|uniref:restriction endonuclease n=1 Tax=Niallia circulans TaxID=1397 RepID=UPI00148F7902|nr:restriction endonuclease [Niallia circulans]QJX63978.1 restriction endonuclease [Niallia circulans]